MAHSLFVAPLNPCTPLNLAPPAPRTPEPSRPSYVRLVKGHNSPGRTEQTQWPSWTAYPTCSSRQSDRPQESGTKEEKSGKLKISGKTEYQLDANRLWDNIKTHQIERDRCGYPRRTDGRVWRAHGGFWRHAEAGQDLSRRPEPGHIGDLQGQRRTLTNPDQIKSRTEAEYSRTDASLRLKPSRSGIQLARAFRVPGRSAKAFALQ